MQGTTTDTDLYEEMSSCLNQTGLPWQKVVGRKTDGAPAICGQRSVLMAKIRQKMHEENVTDELTAYPCVVCGKALKMEHVMGTITQAVKFIYSQRFKSP